MKASGLLVLPPEVKLRPSGDSYQQQLVVQPDASLVGSHTHTLIEAKRLRQGSFQQEQLAREFVAVTREAGSRIPLLLLIIPTPPPVAVKCPSPRTLSRAPRLGCIGCRSSTGRGRSSIRSSTHRPVWVGWVRSAPWSCTCHSGESRRRPDRPGSPRPRRNGTRTGWCSTWTPGPVSASRSVPRSRCICGNASTD